MPRPLRIEYEGAWYHVMNRGAGRKAVFLTDGHRNYFLSLLADTAERFNAEWHAYCLMGNHYHLLLRTPEGNLQRIMRHVNGLYTQYFNRTSRHDGALFRGRYKSVLVDAQTYWLQLSRYIHRNPVEAGMVKKLSAYRWSSYRAYAGLEKPADWLMTRYILKAISSRNRHKAYAAFVDKGVDEEIAQFYGGVKQSPIMGDQRFRKAVLRHKAVKVDIPELKAVRVLPGLDSITQSTAHHFKVDESTLWRSTRGRGVTSPARSVAMYLCQHSGDMRLQEIAEAFGLSSYASAGSVIRNMKGRIERERGLRSIVNTIKRDLTP